MPDFDLTGELSLKIELHMLRPITEKVHSGNGPVSLVLKLPTLYPKITICSHRYNLWEQIRMQVWFIKWYKFNNWLPVGPAHYFHRRGEPKANHLRKVYEPPVWFSKPYKLPPKKKNWFFLYCLFYIVLNRIAWVLTFLVNYHDRNIGYVKLFLFNLLYITFRDTVVWAHVLALISK